MADQIAVVQFTTPAAPGTLDITSSLITETFSCAILIFSHEDDDSADNIAGVMGWGFISAEAGAAAGQAQCMSNLWRDAITTTTQTFNDHSNAQGIRAANNAGTLEIAAAFSASIAGGVRLNFTTAAVQAKCVAILFAGLSRASTGIATVTTGGSAHYNVGPAGNEYAADVLVFLHADVGLTLGANDGIGQIGFALNKAGVPQKSAYINVARTSDPTDADGFLRSDAASGAFTGASRAVMERIVIGSFDSTGFNAEALEDNATTLFLALKFSGNFKTAVANMSVSATTGDQAFNAFAFTPDLVFGMSSLLTSEDAIEDGAPACVAGYFVTGRYGSRAYTMRHDRGHTIAAGTPTDTNTRQEDVAVLTYDTTGAVVQRATWVGGSGSGGFLLNFSAATTAGFLTAIGIQINPDPPRPIRKIRRASRLRRMTYRRPSVPIGRQVVQPFIAVLREIQRFRRAMQLRLRRRVRIAVPPTAVDDTPSAVDKDEMGSAFTGASKRGSVYSGGSEAGGVF